MDVGTMTPRPFGSGVASAAAAAAEFSAGGWAWRTRPRATPGKPVRIGASNPSVCAAASAVPTEHHHGVRFRPLGLPGKGYGWDLEARIEKVIYACRFMTFLAIAGSLAGSVLCFLKVLDSSAHRVHLFGLPI